MAHGRDMAVGVFELLPVLDAVGFQGMRPWPDKERCEDRHPRHPCAGTFESPFQCAFTQ